MVFGAVVDYSAGCLSHPADGERDKEEEKKSRKFE